MSTGISFSFSDWQKVCSAFNLDMSAVMSVLTGDSVELSRGVKDSEASYIAVSDSESETESLAPAVTPAPSDNFATAKTRAFAAKHGISASDLTPSGKKGKITMSDVKKALPPKKRGRKAKPVPTENLDVVDSLVSGAKKAKKSKKSKKVKDPNAPKRPLNAWLLYLNANRDAARAAHPELKMPAITKIISAAYKTISGDEKQAWEAKALAEKSRYQKEMAAYMAAYPGNQPQPPITHFPEETVTKSKSPKKTLKSKKKVKVEPKVEPKVESKVETPAISLQEIPLPTAETSKPLQEEEHFEIDSDSDSDDEEDGQAFEWQGSTYWRTPDGLVFEDQFSPAIGKWDSTEETIVFDDDAE